MRIATKVPRRSGHPHYDPATAQFTTPDSVIPNGPGTQGYGLYGYTENNPATLSDPSGHFFSLSESSAVSSITGALSSGAQLEAQLAWRVYALAIRVNLWLASAAGVGPLSVFTEEEAASTATAEDVPAIETPYGPAVQGTDEASWAARRAVESGARLWRLGTLGKSETSGAQFWALENPTVPDFAARYGIPPANAANADFIESGTLKAGAAFITNGAEGVGTNPGGGIQVVVNPGDVELGGSSTQGSEW